MSDAKDDRFRFGARARHVRRTPSRAGDQYGRGHELVFSNIERTVSVPLGSLEGVAVDAQGNVYAVKEAVPAHAAGVNANR